MMAIPPIPPAPPALPTVEHSGGAFATLVSPEQIDRFRGLMGPAHPASPGQQHEKGPSTLGRIMDAQQTVLNTAFRHVDTVVAQAHAMNIVELTSHQIQLMSEITVATFNLNVATSFAQSSKSAVQTLLKNQ